MTASMTPPFDAAASLNALQGVRHGFFGRAGGVSTGLFATLNCGLGSADDRVHALENRARAARALGIEPGRLLTLHQTHSATAIVVDAPFAGDRPQS
ncbi:MAG: polyphenol oxidase family protein, partial [Parvularculaceae bacterium]|nr:polyphenol oxidase family protein [Parvularculaceae bacterium]